MDGKRGVWCSVDGYDDEGKGVVRSIRREEGAYRGSRADMLASN